MRSFYRIIIAGLIFASVCSRPAFADQKLGAGGAVSLPPPTQTHTGDDAQNSNTPTPDCTRSNSDSRCKPPQLPYYHPHFKRPRPVIINQLPAEPAIEINSLSDDWEGCRKAKLGAMRARDTGNIDQANRLDEWLWKNCRTYSDELRQLEQNDM